MKHLTQRQRLEKWKNTTGKHVVTKKISDDNVINLTCLLCANVIDILGSIPVKLFVKLGSARLVSNPIPFLSSTGTVLQVDTVREIQYPEYKTGRVCSFCKHQVDLSEILPEIDDRKTQVYNSDTTSIGLGHSDGKGY